MTDDHAVASANQGSQRDETVCVVGLGHVGLPLALACVEAGYTVRGFDVDHGLVERLSMGSSHIADVPDSVLELAIAAGSLTFSDNPSAGDGATVTLICVPTPLSDTKAPDMSAVDEAARWVSSWVQPRSLVVLESTVYPGATERYVLPPLAAAGLVAGRDLSVAYSPQRVDPANPTYGIRNTPKVVAGVTPSCSKRARDFYETLTPAVVTAVGVREAELAKLLENTYRHINIALVNELAIVCHDLGLDVWDVIRCAATKPFGFARFDPGPGVGGHCIPIDPSYLNAFVTSELGHPFRMVELAEDVNANMPGYVVRRALDLLRVNDIPVKGASVLMVGVAYKPNVADLRGSPASPIAQGLIEAGAVLAYLDSQVAEWMVDAVPIPRIDLPGGRQFDLVIFLQHQPTIDSQSISALGRLTLDTRGVCVGDSVSHL